VEEGRKCEDIWDELIRKIKNSKERAK